MSGAADALQLTAYSSKSTVERRRRPSARDERAIGRWQQMFAHLPAIRFAARVLGERGMGDESSRQDQKPGDGLARDLALEVGSKIETWLKWRYGLLGAGIAAALLYFGWDVRSSINEKIDNAIVNIEEGVSNKIEDITLQASQAEKEARISLKVTEELQTRSRRTLDAMDPKIAMLDDFSIKIDELKVEIDSLRNALRDENVIRRFDARMDSIESRLLLFEGSIKKTSDILKSELPTQAAEALPTLPETTPLAQQRKDLTTVYFQFAGASREKAVFLSRILREKGYFVPGEERTGGASGKHEVRYFWSDDETAAGQVAKDTNNALIQLGTSQIDVETVDLTAYPGKKPPRGTVELWLELPDTPA
jgi:hypothetical protein